MIIERNGNGSPELWLTVIREIIGDTSAKTIVDLCCNTCWISSRLGFRKMVAVDILPRSLKFANVEFICADVLGDHPVLTQVFDIALCADGIEHLAKADGFRLMERMRKLAPVRVVFTPLGDYMVDENTTNPEFHKSAWFPEDFAKEGYQVIVFPGWHPTLNRGAIWAFDCQDAATIINAIKTKHGATTTGGAM